MRTIISLFTCVSEPDLEAQVEADNPLEFSEVDPAEVTAVVSSIWFDEDADNDLVDLVNDLDEDQCLSLDEEQIAVLFSDFERSIDEANMTEGCIRQWDRFREQVESEFDTNPAEWLSKNMLFIHKLRA